MSRRKCCVPLCPNTINDGVILHSFPDPVKESDRFRQWVLKIGGEIVQLDNRSIHKRRSVCHKHFAEHYRYLSNRISKAAVPELYLQEPDEVQTIVNEDDTTNQSVGQHVHNVDPSTSQAPPTPQKKHCTTGVSLHRFPNYKKFPERFKTWVSLVDGKLETMEDYELYSNKRICDVHFTDDHRNRNNRLSAMAVPSLQLPKKPDSPLEHNYIKKQHIDHNYHKDIPSNTDEQFNSERHAENSKESSQSISQRKERPSTAKRKWDEADVDLSFDDIDQQNDDDVKLEHEYKYFAVDHEIVPVDFDHAIDITTADNKKADLDVELETRQENAKSVHTDFKCNVCHGDIIGFRYSCVQCVNWDMCAACEVRGEHPAHYVLRIPAPTIFADSQPIFTAIREHIKILVNVKNEVEEVYCKEEVCDEIAEKLIPEVSDPITEGKDRSFPELNLYMNIPPSEEYSEDSVQMDTETINTSVSYEPRQSHVLDKFSGAYKESSISYGIMVESEPKPVQNPKRQSRTSYMSLKTCKLKKSVTEVQNPIRVYKPSRNIRKILLKNLSSKKLTKIP